MVDVKGFIRVLIKKVGKSFWNMIVAGVRVKRCAYGPVVGSL